jgi:cysteinyl-tRNA synthetase
MGDTMTLSLYNTLSRSIETFTPIDAQHVGMYCCGPTVYNYAHIGNLRTYVFEDILRRSLEYAGYNVKHVMNITDVGHLSDDADDGEDKMLKAARQQKMDVWAIASMYTDAFFHDTDELNILRPHVACKATEHIQHMIELIQRLEAKGHTYVAGGNVYFSIDTFADYGVMARLNLDDLKEGARIEVDQNKRNPKDFVLWFTQSKFEDQAMVWPSPWGLGYPGWHIECSAMSMEYLGEVFDIHCGGIDHIPVHHTNEIAQSDAATGKKSVNYWIHGEFLLNETGKMSKSKGDFLTLSVLQDKGYDPLDYRFFCLGGHYRTQLTFNWQSMDAAKNGRRNLMRLLKPLQKEAQAAKELDSQAQDYQKEFARYIQNDLNTPRALALLWHVLKDENLSPAQKLTLAYDMDRILGLRLSHIEEQKIPQHILDAVAQRTEAKQRKDYRKADELRAIVEQAGYRLIDTSEGTQIEK